MALITRRHFAREMAFAAALCGRPLWAIGELHRPFDADKQHGAPPDPQTIRKLASQIVGQVITPEAADYNAARSIFNRAFDRRPAVIVRCGSPSDVARALDFAQAQHWLLAVRAGGHSRLGFGMCDGGVVIDLSAMSRVEVDAEKRVARAEAGALVRDLDTATQHFRLATTSGGCPTVGIAGFTLGGGEGRLMEKYGAACDNLLSAQVVTVDGRQVEASPKSGLCLHHNHQPQIPWTTPALPLGKPLPPLKTTSLATKTEQRRSHPQPRHRHRKRIGHFRPNPCLEPSTLDRTRLPSALRSPV